jgi:SAM-dependent methyltransferase
MDDPQVLDRMRADWNQRAQEDANYYVAFGRRRQDEEEFFATGADVMRGLEVEMNRCLARDKALEIGCGPGRLMRPMSRHFREVHGVDVSDEMIRFAQERLRDTPNAFPVHGSGSDLALFRDGIFDFVYSYAVFQHIPSRDVVFQYLREAWRVLKPGGVLRCQVNGLPAQARQYDTWSGVRIAPEEMRTFAREHDFQLLALEQIWTQYMWVTCRKRGAPRPPVPGRDREGAAPRIHNISNALTGEAAAPNAGGLAAICVWVRGLPGECDLNNTIVTADRRPCRLIYIGHPAGDGVVQTTAALPEGMRTGLVPIEITLDGRAVGAPGWVRIIPAGPLVPRLTAVSDGVNLLSGNRIVTGLVKVTMEEVADAAAFHATVDGLGALDIDSFCTDPVMQRWEFNFRLPPSISNGPHQVAISLGRRSVASVPIEVAPADAPSAEAS